MLTTVKKWGNSQGLRFPKTILADAQIDVGDNVNISVQNGKIIIEKVNRVRTSYNLKDLVAKIPENYRTEELGWGAPVGREEW